MLELAKQIVEEFEKNIPGLYEPFQFENERENLLLYLAAKAYLHRYE